MSKTLNVRFRDLSVDDPQVKDELLQAVDNVLTHGQLLLGPEVELLEKKLADYCGRKFCVGVASGTDALYLALVGLGIGSGDEVITTPLSWIATLNAIYQCGAKAVFVDINEDLNINVDLLEDAITSRTKAIVPVHFTGRLCNMERICAIAEKHKILVIEDAAQAFGAQINGKVAGSFGDASALSMNPMKVLPAYGEAGAILTDDQNVFEKLVALRYLGTVNKEVCYYPSLNAKIDTLQAAMLLVSMKYFERIIDTRIKVAQYYSSKLVDVVKCPPVPDSYKRESVFFDYVIVVDQRDDLRRFLKERGIETKIKHPILMPHQPAYANMFPGSWPVAKNLVNQIVSLPAHEKLTQDHLDWVVNSTGNFINTN